MLVLEPLTSNSNVGLTVTFAPKFLLLGVVLLAPPMAAELSAKSMIQNSSLGLSILLYEPFHFAYAALAVASFSALGWREAKSKGNSLNVGAVAGAAIGVAWFVIAFLVLAQLHVSLGGSL